MDDSDQEDHDQAAYQSITKESDVDSDYKALRQIKINFNELSQIFPVENTAHDDEAR